MPGVAYQPLPGTEAQPGAPAGGQQPVIGTPSIGEVFGAQSVYNSTFDVGRKIYETGVDVSDWWSTLTRGQSPNEMFSPHNPNSAMLGHPAMFDQSSIVGTPLEPYADRFQGLSAVEGETQRKRLQTELDNNSIIERAPWYETLPTGAVQVALDPMTYLFAPDKVASTIPFLRRTAQTALAFGKAGAASETVAAGVRQATTETRTWEDEAIAIGLGATLGSLIGGLVPSVGSARNALAQYWNTRSHLTGFAPTGRLSASPLSTSRATLDALVEHGLETGNAARPNVETTILQGTDAEMAKLSQGWREDFLVQDSGPWITRGARFNSYLEEVGMAARRDPALVDPRLQRSVDRWNMIASKLGKELLDAKLNPNQAAPLYTSLRTRYVPQRWDLGALRTDPNGFVAMLQSQGFSKADAEAVRLRIITRPKVNLFGNVPKASPLKQRTLEVDPTAAAPYLVRNIHTLADDYLRSVVPRVELTREFGHYNMADQIQKIRDEAMASGNVRKIERAEADIADVELVRNRLLGTHGDGHDPASLMLTAGRILRNESAASQLGSASWSSVQEFATPILKYGAVNYVRGLKRMVTGWGATRQQMKDLGLAANNVLARWQGISTDTAAGKLERFTRFGANTVNKLSGLEIMTNLQRQLNYAVSEQVLLRADLKHIAGMGSRDAVEVFNQIQAHKQGNELNLGAWTNPAAVADVLEMLAADVRHTIVSPGAGDLPKFMTENELGRYVTQFTSFMYSYWYRVMRPAVQKVTQQHGADRFEGVSRMVQGMTGILALGWLAQTARSHTAGRNAEWNALSGGEQVAQVLNNVGVTGPIVDTINKVDMAFGYPIQLPGNFKYKFGSQWALLGPAVSQATDLGHAAIEAAAGTPDPNWARKVRRAIPLQNLWWARRVFDEMWPASASVTPTTPLNEQKRGQKRYRPEL